MSVKDKINATVGSITFILNALGAVGILAMVVVVNVDVFGRGFFNQPLPGVAEFVGLAIVAIVWLQAADTLRHKRFIRSDVLFNALATRKPVFARFLTLLFDLNGLVIVGLIFYFSIPLFQQSLERGYYRGTPGVMTIPVWPIKLLILIGCAALFVQILLFLYFNLKKTGSGSSK